MGEVFCDVSLAFVYGFCIRIWVSGMKGVPVRDKFERVACGRFCRRL